MLFAPSRGSLRSFRPVSVRNSQSLLRRRLCRSVEVGGACIMMAALLAMALFV